MDLSLLLPETNTSRDILRSLDLNAKVATGDGKWKWKKAENAGKWRSCCSHDDGWVDCWFAPRVQLNIEFLFHPVPPPGPPPQADVPTPEKEMQLLGPLHAPVAAAASTSGRQQSTTSSGGGGVSNPFASSRSGFEPDRLEADKCRVFLKVDSSTAYLVCGFYTSTIFFIDD